MAETTRYGRIRRILGFLALAGAVALLAREGCGRGSGTTATIRVRFGDAADQVRSLRVDLFACDGGSAAFFERAFPSGAPDRVDFAVKVAGEGDYQAELLIGRVGESVRTTRRLHLENRATISLDLAEAVAPAVPAVP